ncbi:MAG: prepilin-type N-terminal cleavage/methylation domain-containing protein [Patescibacteria group bacterium]|nr:prepilin-type N-terminal cleavage/methylation domain-containing protein [Patescibacteria group bacterium]
MKKIKKIQLKAFTLVELAVVLLVIGILAGLFLSNIGTFTSGARDTRRLGDLRNVAAYLTQYYLKTGTFIATTATGPDWNNVLAQELVNKGVLTSRDQLPQDPSGGINSYGYYACRIGSAPTGSTYILTANLEAATSEVNIYKGSGNPVNLTCHGNVPVCFPTSTVYCLIGR